jgi:4-amino-4-deoxy-L-arabinose transferase-like glycosyltransferase
LATITAIVFFWGFWDVNAPRQGTEGFYLQILKEMSLRGEWITPFHHGLPHFSKPPLHFWLALPLAHIPGLGIMAAGRLTILIFSLALLWPLSTVLSRKMNLSRFSLFIFLAANLGFIKYSRIYMMEMPLALLGTLAFFLLYESLCEKRSFWPASIALGLATLVKGPISLVMTAISIAFFYILRWKFPKRDEWGLGIKFFTAALLVASPWFIACFFIHGDAFISYFFFRENAGKFSSANYPLSVLFQGLFIFTLPWVLFPLFSLKKFAHNFKRSFDNEDHFSKFLIAGFIGHFFIWLIPSQRSHHYAMPAAFFFMALILSGCTNLLSKDEVVSKTRGAVAVIFATLISALLVIEFQFNQFGWLPIIATGMSLIATIIAFFYRKNFENFTLTILLASLILWNITVPFYALPLVPNRIVELVPESAEISTRFRKPLFVSEVFGRNVEAITPDQLLERVSKGQKQYFLTSENELRALEERGVIIARIANWEVWKRGSRAAQITNALKRGDLSDLKEKMVLFTP